MRLSIHRNFKFRKFKIFFGNCDLKTCTKSKGSKIMILFWNAWIFKMKTLNFSLHLKQDITSKLNWFENNFGACRFENIFQSLFLWQQLFGACRSENGFMGAIMGLIVPTSWIWNSYSKSVFQIITGRPLRGPRLAARITWNIKKIFLKIIIWQSIALKTDFDERNCV